MFLAPFQFLHGLPKLLMCKAQVLLRLMVLGHVPADASQLEGAPSFVVIDLSPSSQVSDCAIVPHNAEFSVVFRSTLERSGDGLLHALAVVGVHQRGKSFDRRWELADGKAEEG